MKTKFSYKKFAEIKSLIELGVPIAKIARKFKITRQTIHHWLNTKSTT